MIDTCFILIRIGIRLWHKFLDHDSNIRDNGLTLCHRVILDSVAPQWVRARTSTVQGARTRKGRGWTDNKSRSARTTRTIRSWVNCLCRNKCSHTVILKSYMIAELALEDRWFTKTLRTPDRRSTVMKLASATLRDPDTPDQIENDGQFECFSCECELPCLLQGDKLVQSICFLTEVLMLRYERERSRSGESIIIKKINQMNEHIQIPYDDKFVDGSVVMQRQEPLDVELLKNVRFDGNDTENSEQKYRCLILKSTWSSSSPF